MTFGKSKLIATRKLLPIVALAFIGVLTVLLTTRFGIGITPDSTVYVDAARNLADGRGLTALTASGESKPLTHYPPLYPSVLASLSINGLSIESARWLNALLFGANILLVGLILSRYAKDSFWLPVLASFLMLTAPDIAGIHTLALTEPLFLFFTLTGLILLAAYVDSQNRALLVGCAIAAAVALLTRYVGIVLVFTGTAALLVLNGRSVRRKLADTITFAAVACLPMAWWAIRNHQVAAEATDRSLVFHPIKLGQIVSGVSTVSSWLLLGKVRADVRAIGFMIEIVIIAAVVAHLFVRRTSRVKGCAQAISPGLQKLPHLLSIFIVFNLAFLIFTASFVDADTVLDDRSLVAVHVAVLILIPVLAWRLYRSSTLSRNMRVGFVIAALVFAGSYSLRTVSWFARTRGEAQGYASRTWQKSETIEQIRMLPQGTPIYSNGYDAIYYLTGRPAIYVPEKVVPGTGRVNQNYEAEMDRMESDLREHHGVLVYFNTLPERWFLPSESELKTRLSLTEIAKGSDGSISIR